MRFGIMVAGLLIISSMALAGPQKMAKKMAPMKMDKAMWQKNYDTAARDFSKMNAKSMFKWMTPDFTMTGMGHNMNRAESEKMMTQEMGMMKDFHCTFKVNGVTEKNGMVMVDNSFHFWGTTKAGKGEKKGHKMDDRGKCIDTWVKGKNGQWMMKNINTTSDKMTMDGKPFNPPTAPAKASK